MYGTVKENKLISVRCYEKVLIIAQPFMDKYVYRYLETV